MKKSTIVAIRWVAVIVGITSAIVGFFMPGGANETNHLCWFSVFFLAAPYPEK